MVTKGALSPARQLPGAGYICHRVTGTPLTRALRDCGALQGNNRTGALDHDAGRRHPTAVSRAFSTCPSGLLRAGAFTFNERFRRLRCTNGAIDKNRISRLYRKCLLRHRNVTGLLDIKVPPPSVFLKAAAGGALSGVRVCHRSTQSAWFSPFLLRLSVGILAASTGSTVNQSGDPSDGSSEFSNPKLRVWRW